MTRIMISLNTQERDALHILAEREFRDPRAQAALIIRRELERLDLLRAENVGNTGDAQLLALPTEEQMGR